jgi:hypothetical protein
VRKPNSQDKKYILKYLKKNHMQRTAKEPRQRLSYLSLDVEQRFRQIYLADIDEIVLEFLI